MLLIILMIFFWVRLVALKAYTEKSKLEVEEDAALLTKALFKKFFSGFAAVDKNSELL